LDEEPQNDFDPPTPPVPTRKPISKLVAYQITSIPADNTDTTSDDLYLHLVPSTPTEEEDQSTTCSSKVLRHGHFSPPMESQKTMPELPNPPLYDASTLPRKQSLQPVIPLRVPSPKFDNVGNSKVAAVRRTPAPPPPKVAHRLPEISNQAESNVPQPTGKKGPAVSTKPK